MLYTFTLPLNFSTVRIDVAKLADTMTKAEIRAIFSNFTIVFWNFHSYDNRVNMPASRAANGNIFVTFKNIISNIAAGMKLFYLIQDFVVPSQFWGEKKN